MTTVIETLTTLGLPAQNLSLEQSLQALNSLPVMARDKLM